MNAYGVGLQAPLSNFGREARIPQAWPQRAPTEPLRLHFGRFELDEANARLLCDAQAVDLPPKPFELLCALARRPGLLVTKNALLDEVWGHRFVSESVLKTVIGKLRIALQDDARNPRFIETVPRRGYRFIGTQSPTRDPATPAPKALETADVTAVRVLGEIREMLLHLIEQPHERHRAARIVDYIGRCVPATVNEGS